MISLTQGLLNLNPAFNNSIIEFQSDLGNPINAKLLIDGLNYELYPYPTDGKFKFNLTDMAKASFTTDKFRDSIIPDLSQGFVYFDPNIVKDKTVLITVMNSATTESQTFNFSFYRGVEQQVGYYRKAQLANNTAIRIMLPTKNYVTYEVVYFEGQVFDFAVHGLQIGDEVVFKNPQTSYSSDIITVIESGTTRFFLSDGADETTFDNVILLNSALNRVELWVNGSFVANLNIYRRESECGIYLKWLNDEGAYSYWRFGQIYSETIKTKDLDSIAGDWKNLQESYSNSYLVGKTATNSMKLESIFDHRFIDNLKSLLTSVQVEMFIHSEPFQQVEHSSDWVKVNVHDGTFIPFDSKDSKTKISLSIDLPPVNTITL